MTYEQAIEKAREESKLGYVVHVNHSIFGGYHLSDWHNGDNTVISFENGKEL